MAHRNPSSSHPIFLLETEEVVCLRMAPLHSCIRTFDPGLAELFWEEVRGDVSVGEGAITVGKVSKVHPRPSQSVCLPVCLSVVCLFSLPPSLQLVGNM